MINHQRPANSPLPNTGSMTPPIRAQTTAAARPAAATTPPSHPAAAKPSVIAERFKTKPCRNFMRTGACPYEHRCMFAHGTQELRTVAMNMAEGLDSEEAILEYRRALFKAGRPRQHGKAALRSTTRNRRESSRAAKTSRREGTDGGGAAGDDKMNNTSNSSGSETPTHAAAPAVPPLPPAALRNPTTTTGDDEHRHYDDDEDATGHPHPEEEPGRGDYWPTAGPPSPTPAKSLPPQVMANAELPRFSTVMGSPAVLPVASPPQSMPSSMSSKKSYPWTHRPYDAVPRSISTNE